MRPLLIKTHPFDASSAGVRVMHYLAALLNAADVPVAVTSPCFYNPALPVRDRALPDDIVVYPDACRGNEHGGTSVCRYMLYYASAYFGGDRIKKDECAIVFQKSYLADIQAHCDHPMTEDDIVHLPTLDATWCFPEPKSIENVVYPGKGDLSKMPKIDGQYIVIPKNPPRENDNNYGSHHFAHQRTLALLRRAKNFYTLDPNTMMSAEAGLCGCKVFILNNGRFEERVNVLAEAREHVLNPQAAVTGARRFANRVYQFFSDETETWQLPTAPAFLEQAESHFKDGQFTDAARAFFGVLKHDANNAEASLGLGLCFFKQGNREMARKSFERVLALRPNHPMAPQIAQMMLDSAAASPSGPKKITVGVFTLDDPQSACAQLRCVGPLSYLRDQGRIQYLPLCEVNNGRVTLLNANILRSQIIVVQRGMPSCLPYSALRDAIKNPAVKIVFELDDALTQLPGSNPHCGYFRAMRPQLETYLRNADLVTVSTPRLKEIYSGFNENIEVLPNTLDPRIWQSLPGPTRADGKVRILFSGTLTHQSDLGLIEKAIEQVIQELGDKVEFLFWGNPPASLGHLPQVRHISEFSTDYAQYAQRLKCSGVDLAIVPLEATPFNRAKSNIKWLEYSACKIPGIFTAIDPYCQSIEHGKTGWLVGNTTEEWREAIKKLVLDSHLRRSIAENAQQTVLSRHSLERNAAFWMQAYEQVLARPPKVSFGKTMETSIVIPTYNNLHLTRNCLAAIAKNTPQGNYEIIVVDNASTDGTVEFLQGENREGRLHLLPNQENAGFAHACNQGAQAARGKYILFLNNDTEVQSGWLDALTAAMGRPQTGIAGAKLLYGNGRIQHAGIVFIGPIPDHPHRNAPADTPEANQFRELDMVTGACLMVRRELFLKLAGFDEIYRNGVEDIDLCLRVRAAGWKVVYEPKAVAFHLEGQSVGRFNHVVPNLKNFFHRWGRSFDAEKHFIVPKPARTMAAQRSFLLAEETVIRKKALPIAWEGPFLDFGSMSHTNRELASRLCGQSDLQVCMVGNKTLSPAAKACPDLSALAHQLHAAAGADTRVTVRHQWPPNWNRPGHGALVLFQPWEFGSLPAEWVQKSANVDEFWVPSNYVRQVYLDSGIPADKVAVIPNGVDSKLFQPGLEPLPLDTRKSFRFLFVGGTIRRKGPDVLLKAYLEAFTAADDVCLVIKDFGGDSYYRGQTLEKEIAAARQRPNAPEILYLNSELPPADVPRLYAACQCLVHPYRGEGFGMPVLEAMACGLPVIVTKGGATDDFVSEDSGWFISAKKEFIGKKIGSMQLVGDGWWLEPDVSDLAAKLKEVRNKPDEAKARGRCGAVIARGNYSWDRVAAQVKTRLQQIAEQTTLPAVKPDIKVELPATALIGYMGPARQALNHKQYREAWNLAAESLKSRPFHPEAWSILAESAHAAGATAPAKRCQEILAKLAPNWKPLHSSGKKKSRAGKVPTAWPSVPEISKSPRLSVCLIVKNEEQFIEQCLRSVRDIAHQIVVVDTGSTDRTVEIAKKFDAEIHSFAWTEDFSAARNEALKYATGDWILSLDADEELMPEHRQTIAEEMQAANVLGYRLPITNFGREDEGCGYVPRLFRNAPGLFFVGRVHEQVFSSIEVRAHEWGMKNSLGRTALLHHGYKKEIVESRDKVARNLRLLKLAVEELPGDPNLVMNLGLELIRSGQFEEGLEQYQEALRLISQLRPGEVTPEFREALLTQLSKHLLSAGRSNEVVELWQQPFAQVAEPTASQHFLLGGAYLDLKQNELAADQLRQCLKKRGKPALSPVISEVLKAGPNHCLAVALVGLGQDAEAEKHFRAALQEDPQSRPARLDFAKFQSKHGQPLDALKLLTGLVDEEPKDIPAWLLGGEIALSQPEFLEFAGNWTSEAVKNFADDCAIALQRAEALTLSGQTAAALPVWTRAGSPGSARHFAALTLCEVLGGNCQRKFSPGQEKAVSQEFLKWYRRLISYRASTSIKAINEKLEDFQAIVPTAVQALSVAMKQAETGKVPVKA
jgi:GT2 family glycosyltransferase/tetratricopeptide (TPR) repeat protein